MSSLLHLDSEQWVLFPTYGYLSIPTHGNSSVGIPECTGTRTINASGKFELPIPMRRAPPGMRQHLTWSFTLAAKDIFFSVEFQAENSTKREVVSDRQFYLSSKGPIEGSVPIIRSGIFYFVWDNNYSYFTTKTVTYKAGVRSDDYTQPSSWNINIHGWVHLPKLSAVKRIMTVALLKKFLGLEEQHEATAKFEERFRMFLTRECPNKSMVIEIPGVMETVDPIRVEVHTTETGKFATTIQIDTKDLEKYVVKQDNMLHVPVRISSPADEGRILGGTVPLLSEHGLSVISDVDDTIKHSEITLGKKKVLENIFLKDAEPVEGMVSLYQHWASLGATFHYVSNSPWQLTGMLLSFVEKHAFPKGTFHLKTFSLNDHTRGALLQPPAISKRTAIYQLFKDFPHRKFILVGDSGEKDAELYADAARSFPDQVLFVFIRKIPPPLVNLKKIANELLDRGKDEEGEEGKEGKEGKEGAEAQGEEKKGGASPDQRSAKPAEEIDLGSDSDDPAGKAILKELDGEVMNDLFREVSLSGLHETDLSEDDLEHHSYPGLEGAPSSKPPQPLSPQSSEADLKDALSRMQEVFEDFDPERWMLFENPSDILSSQFFTQMVKSVVEK